MLSGFDHIVIAVNDLGAAARAYEQLLACRPLAVQSHDGYDTAFFHTSNLGVELMSPRGESEMARRLRDVLAEGEGLKSLVFATEDIRRAHRRAERVGLVPEPIREAASAGAQVFRLGNTNGVRLFVMQRAAASRADYDGVCPKGLDHIVVRAPRGEEALGLYGARLGLSLRLETHVAGRRLMMLRCGDAVLEIAEDKEQEQSALWGVSWRVADVEGERARLAAVGLDVSDVRAGVKQGTRVFTVRDGTCNVPTLIIEHGISPG